MHVEMQCTYIFIIFIHSLQDNDNIGEEGGVAICEALRGMTNLQHLKQVDRYVYNV